MVSLVSWEYPTYFMVIQPKIMEGHPIILGRTWLAIGDTYTSCRKGELTISNGLTRKQIMLHSLAQLASTNVLWVEDPYEHEEIEQPIVNVEQTRRLQDQTKENILD